jgi:uncharacterized Zn-binding protein involved in type VI secretion
MAAAARQTDMAKHDGPHCHAPIHPPAPVPTPVPHPAVPIAIMSATSPTVKINSLAAAVVTSQTLPCQGPPPCVPAGPGLVAMGSMTVLITCLPAARANDMVAFASCVAPIPSPTGKIQSPCSSNVMIGG